MTATFHETSDAAQWIEEVAAALAGALEETLAAAPRATFASGGGRTPGPILERLAEAPLDWARVRIVPTDDRCVAEDHPARNAAMLRTRLAKAAAAGAEIVALEDAPDAAPDVVLLGFGEDQHVASIFPAGEGMAAARAPNAPTSLRTTPDPLPPEAPFSRVTLSMPALLGARAIVIAAQGETKRAAYEAAREGRPPLTPLAEVLVQTRAPVALYWRSDQKEA
ncbi:MAG: 6-phosphogluconolactonase [Maricaulaceae bacterium]|jgi:6-phosphogluconolactonase